MGFMDKIRKGIRSWLQIQPTPPYAVQIQEYLDFELNAIRNRIWYRGDGNELQQLYSQLNESADKYKFWASQSTPGQEIRKIHTGIPSLIVRVLSSIVMADMNDITVDPPVMGQVWEEIEKENDFRNALKDVIEEVLYIGDGAYKVSIDTEISQYPILEWYPGERIELVRNRGRLREVIFKTPYKHEGQQYVLHEHYGYGYIKNELYKGDELVDRKTIPVTQDISDWEFDKSVILAVPIKVFDSAKWKGRGRSIFDGKLDNFDALDETWSQWMDAIRTGRSKSYIPECLTPKDPNTGKTLRPNPFDNRYILTETAMGEHQENKIYTEQPDIPHDSYMAAYITALDLCLQGIISPSTLGIDTKKLDNAEAQREKEKTTLYTRDAIVGSIQDNIPKVISAALNAYNIMMKQSLRDIKAEIPFGEYANPSFESQVETVSKAKTGGIMSIEASVEELYGDTRDEDWKKEEVARLKAEQGIESMEEPGVNLEGVTVNEGEGGEQNIPDVPGKIPGTFEGGI